ncbi:MAG: hypothetical protein ACOYL6_08460 [Bacteriovoracaceae bacterium]
MKTIISSMQVFISQFLVIAILGSGISIFAGEVRLAVLRKASQGSSKLSNFTKRMTKP